MLSGPATLPRSQPRWVEAMKRRSKAGGKSAKAQASESLKLKPDTVPNPAAARSSAMQQTADWLERLGLVQYAQRFAENDISFSVLPDLTDQDLKEIGVSLGHRRQLLRAIAELTGREKDAPKAAVAETADLKNTGRVGPSIHPHMLRHSTGFKLANDGHDTRSLAHYLRHRNLQSTAKYTALAPGRFADFWKD